MKIAVIPARGGSKRIPGKNIRVFEGRPIIAYSIEAARACRLFDRVIVSTDSEEIATVAREWGAETPFLRPAELSDDHSGTDAVVKHAIAWLGERGHEVSHACCIYATAPFLQAVYLREGHDKLIASGKSFVFSVTTFPFPVQRALRLTEAGEVEALYPQSAATRSQDLEKAYHDAAQFYWGTARAFTQEEEMFSRVSLPLILPRYLVQDIDDEEDWRSAEFIYRAWQRSREIQ